MHVLWYKKILDSYSLPTHPPQENFVSLSIFWTFFAYFLTIADLQGLTHLTPSKSTNEVTLCDKHKNHFFLGVIELAPQLHKSLTSVHFLSCSPKEERATLIDRGRYHLQYGSLENQKSDVNKLIENILVNLTPSTTWFEGVSISICDKRYHFNKLGTFSAVIAFV